MLQETRLHQISALLATLDHVTTGRISKALGYFPRNRAAGYHRAGGARRVVPGTRRRAGGQTNIRAATGRAQRGARQGKRTIARAAARLMQPGQMVFLDAGTTTMLTEELSTMAGLTIFTNSLDAARKLAAASEQTPGAHQVIVIGGELVPRRP